MSEEIRTIVDDELNKLAELIRQHHTEAGQVASGRTRNSIKVETSGGNVVVGTVYGRAFFGTLETGSKPWSVQYATPPKPFVQTIQQWIDDKGLDLNAFLTARKIMQEGSKLFRDGGRNDIYSNEIPKTLDTIADRVSALYESQVIESIKLNLK